MTFASLSKSRIDALGQQLRTGRADAACLRDLERFRALYMPAYREVEKVLTEQMHLKITGRPSKSTVAIAEKLRRETTRLSQVQDIAGCRVLCTNIDAQDRFVGTMKILLGRTTVDDKRENPTNGYRAVHVVAIRSGSPVEIQVRTALQHAWAEISEKLADQFGHSIKYGSGDATVLEFLSNLSSKLRELDLVRQQRKQISDEKIWRGKTRETVRKAKGLNRRENELLRQTRELFGDLERIG